MINSNLYFYLVWKRRKKVIKQNHRCPPRWVWGRPVALRSLGLFGKLTSKGPFRAEIRISHVVPGLRVDSFTLSGFSRRLPTCLTSSGDWEILRITTLKFAASFRNRFLENKVGTSEASGQSWDLCGLRLLPTGPLCVWNVFPDL